MVYPSLDLERLTVAERLQLIEQVWDSLRQRADVLTLSADEHAVIEARRADHHADPTSAVDWESVRADLLNDQAADEARTNRPPRR